MLARGNLRRLGLCEQALLDCGADDLAVVAQCVRRCQVGLCQCVQAFGGLWRDGGVGGSCHGCASCAASSHQAGLLEFAKCSPDCAGCEVEVTGKLADGG